MNTTETLQTLETISLARVTGGSQNGSSYSAGFQWWDELNARQAAQGWSRIVPQPTRQDRQACATPP